MPAADYRTGTEFHIEGAVSQYLSKQFSIGVVGYYYQQISHDGGAGARLGGFRRRVAALGGTTSYTFNVGKVPATTRGKLVREFDVENRLQGAAGWLTLSMPIYVEWNVRMPRQQQLRRCAAGRRETYADRVGHEPINSTRWVAEMTDRVALREVHEDRSTQYLCSK